MNTIKQSRMKSRAQAMVEFALALPLLLLVVYGLLETGRLLFIYASTVTAARQAVRFGSATGINAGGTPYFMDCDGIRTTAQGVGFINRFESSDIHITYDRGLDEDGDLQAIPGVNPAPESDSCPIGSGTIQNGDRIKVQVSTNWEPIVPIVPFDPFTITSRSSRTILVSVAIGVTAPPGYWVPSGSGVLELSVSATPPTYYFVGQTIYYSYTLDNTGAGDLSEPFSVIDATTTGGTITTSCAGAPATLAPADPPFTCSGEYVVKLSDLDAGFVTDNATALANGSPSNTLGETVLAIQNPQLTLDKSADRTAAPAGTPVRYTYLLDNTGNVTLSGPFTIFDDKLGTITCAGPLGPDTPPILCGELIHPVNENDVIAGSITNIATASFTYTRYDGTLVPLQDEDRVTIITNPISVTAAPIPLIINETYNYALMPPIHYDYLVRNNSDDGLSFTIENGDFTPSIDCPTQTLGEGASTTCTANLPVTQPMLDAGGTLVNTVTVKAPGLTSSSTTSVSVNPPRGLSLLVSPTNTTQTTAGNVNYTFTLTNSGRVTLTSPFSVSDNKGHTYPCADQTPLGPGLPRTCSGAYPVEQLNLNAGSVSLQFTASAMYGGQAVPSSPQPATIITFVGPRLKLTVTSLETSVTEGGTIHYEYTLTNIGGVALNPPFTVSDNKASNEICLKMTPLALGESTKCTGEYPTTLADATAGSVTNTASATANCPSSCTVDSEPPPTSVNSVTVTVNPYCWVKHGNLTLPAFTMNIKNKSLTQPFTISRIVIHWNDQPSTQKLNHIRLGGVQIWSETGNNSPDTTANLSGSIADRTINANTTKLLDIDFDDPYTPFSPVDEWITVTFADARCAVLDSRNAGQLEAP